jgi:hypothetical protein
MGSPAARGLGRLGLFGRPHAKQLTQAFGLGFGTTPEDNGHREETTDGKVNRIHLGYFSSLAILHWTPNSPNLPGARIAGFLRKNQNQQHFGNPIPES